ncbi:hypothetical protein GCM10022225_27390 [Plantactinospora mayteni]|uniref:Aminoglycoside phosphotransferase domain-containing protein n=1 Tax=Plantactinospora mayteni TaxID=566021 RepID=A0ABQ4EJX0_9ACTN|nr:aminoglycoside phosphotransferase family protein [Plantactinospora mayteni]GIG94531.1 hypothetical protein Pma05_11040 [Plantactinospora mayteni]
MIDNLVTAQGEQARAARARRLLGGLRDARINQPEHQAQALRDLGLDPVAGGRNNDVYQWSDADATPICVKVYRVDERRRLEREWNALTLLASAGVDGIPRPLWCLDDPAMPVIGMTLLPGTSVPDLPDPVPAVTAMPDLLRRIHAAPLTAGFSRLPRIDSAEHYVERINRTWAVQLLQHERDELTIELRGLLGRWRRSGDGDVACEWRPRTFSRGDANLINWLWDGHTIRVVDFEFCGHSDLVFDAADLIEHISGRLIPDDIWQALLPELGVAPQEQQRFRACQRTCALRWLAVLWKQRDQRAAEFGTQLTRVRHLFTDLP